MAKFTYKNGKIAPYKQKAKKNLHSVHQDTIDPTVSPLSEDGSLIFDSLSAYKAHLKENGYEITGGAHNDGAKNMSEELHLPAEEIARRADWGMLRVRDSMIRDVLIEENKLKWGMSPYLKGTQYDK